MDADTRRGGLDEVSLLSDPVRRRLYEFVVGALGPVTRDDASKATDLSRSLAAYHLDRLAEGGLLDVDYARRNGRSGPGAGRPAKQYSRSTREVSVSLPPRNYSLLAHVLAAAADAAPSPAFAEALASAATQEGRALGEHSGRIHDALVTGGYEPITDDAGDIIMRNCPFHAIVEEHTQLACGLNRAFVEGVLSGAGCDPDRAELSPAAGRCCVVVHPAESASA